MNNERNVDKDKQRKSSKGQIRTTNKGMMRRPEKDYEAPNGRYSSDPYGSCDAEMRQTIESRSIWMRGCQRRLRQTKSPDPYES